MAQLKSTTVNGNVVASHGDLAFTQTSTVNNRTISFGFGANGNDRGLYDHTLGKWILYSDGTNTRIGNSSQTYYYGVNNILWSGGLYMNASQTATLSQAVSAQPHGIILVWSLYGDGTAHNNNWNSFFIPKQLVASHGGSSFSMFIARANLASCCQKSLTIQDTKIVGVATNNQAAATSSSITNSPNTSVLRYVIGV